jgi:hypothetical protein
VPVALGLVDLGIFLALAFLIALSYAYNYSLGAAIVALARAIGSIRLPGFLGGGRLLGFAADALTGIDDTIRHSLGVGIAALQATWNEAVSYTATAIHWIGKEIASLAHDTAQAIEGLTVTQVTNVYKKVNPGLARKVGALAAAVAVLRRELTHVVTREAHTAKAKAQAVEHAIAVPDVGAVPRAIPKVGQLEREIAEALARGRDLLRRVGPAALLGTVAFALARLGITWARCSRVNKAGKRLCGMNDDLLDSLLADTLLIVGTVSLVEFARGMQDVTREVVGPIRTFWRVT